MIYLYLWLIDQHDEYHSLSPQWSFRGSADSFMFVQPHSSDRADQKVVRRQSREWHLCDY